MIFVSLGTSHKPFDDLLIALDNYVKIKKINMIAQIGFCKYEPKYIKWFRFADEDTLKNYILQSRFVITHGGYGIISDCIALKKPILAIPRIGKKTAVNNHQIQLLEYLDKLRVIDYVKSLSELINYLELNRTPPEPNIPYKSVIPEKILEIINSLE